MGVAGAGKSTVGELVAGRLGVPFLDADAFHDESSVVAMRAGVALDDHQRQAWLHRLNGVLRAHQSTGVLLACSALKRSYRDALLQGIDNVLFVYLAVSEDVLASRLGSRVGHYAGVELLASQLAALELGDDLIAVDGEMPPEQVADDVVRIIARRCS